MVLAHATEDRCQPYLIGLADFVILLVTVQKGQATPRGLLALLMYEQLGLRRVEGDLLLFNVF